MYRLVVGAGKMAFLHGTGIDYQDFQPQEAEGCQQAKNHVRVSELRPHMEYLTAKKREGLMPSLYCAAIISCPLQLC